MTEGRKALLGIVEAGFEAINTGTVMRQMLRVDGNTLFLDGQMIDLATVERIIFVAVGKCAADAAVVADEVLGSRITTGIVVDIKPCPPLAHMVSYVGTHPLPSDANYQAAKAVIEMLRGLTERDLVIFVISGGGSTLLFIPLEETGKEEIAVFNTLTKAGATIQELNTVRKHLSSARGGFLAQYAYPARIVSLIFSDVTKNDVSFVASGPTVKDTTTVADAQYIISKFKLLETAGLLKCDLIETPKDEKYFERVKNVLAVSNIRALDAMRVAAEKAGFTAKIRETELTGEASAVARAIAEELHAAPPKTVLLWGGETTVTIKGPGRGGRNLELAASALPLVHDDEEILSFSSDGHDHGPYAGAICDTITKRAASEKGIDTEVFRMQSNTYELFERIGNYVMTGDTGSNVADLIVGMKL